MMLSRSNRTHKPFISVMMNLHHIRNAVSPSSPFEIQERLKSNESVCVLSKLSLGDGCNRS